MVEIVLKSPNVKSLPYCHQYFFGGKYDLIQLHTCYTDKLYIKMMGYP